LAFTAVKVSKLFDQGFVHGQLFDRDFPTFFHKSKLFLPPGGARHSSNHAFFYCFY